MKRILFIYGYGGSTESTFCTLIREALNPKEYEVLCPVYPQEDCQKAHKVLLKFVEDNHIDLIIGTSLGGFIALTLNTTKPTIVINPCMMPSVELPKLKPRPDHPDDVAPSAELVASYKPFESMAFDREAHKGRWVMGLFAEQDELLGTKYKQPFIDCYDNAWSILGGHYGNAAALPVILKAIMIQCSTTPYNKRSDKNPVLSDLYAEYYYKVRDYCLDHYKDDEFQYFWQMTDY